MLIPAGIKLLVTFYLAGSSLLQETEDFQVHGLMLSPDGIKLLVSLYLAGSSLFWGREDY